MGELAWGWGWEGRVCGVGRKGRDLLACIRTDFRRIWTRGHVFAGWLRGAARKLFVFDWAGGCICVFFAFLVYLENGDKALLVCWLRWVLLKSECERCAIWRFCAFWGVEGGDGGFGVHATAADSHISRECYLFR